MVSIETSVAELSLLAPIPPLRKPLVAELLTSPTGLGEFEELCWHYLHPFPSAIHLGQIKTYLIKEDAEVGLRVEGPGGGSRLEFDSRLFLEGEQVGQLMVSLYRRPGSDPDEFYLELEQAHLWEPELRGRGLGRAMFENVLALGRVLGVRAITLFALYDGRFVWPNLGFQFGDYLPEPSRILCYQRRFRAYCLRHGVEPPDLRGWDAPQFARFVSEKRVSARIGNRYERYPCQVDLGRAFMLTRRPFFLCFPLLQL